MSDFVLPEPGSDAMVDLLVRIDKARYAEAKACVVVAIDDVTGDVAHATGPFTEPEQALIDAGRQDADWKAHAEPEEGVFTYVVVPLWEPDVVDSAAAAPRTVKCVCGASTLQLEPGQRVSRLVCPECPPDLWRPA